MAFKFIIHFQIRMIFLKSQSIHQLAADDERLSADMNFKSTRDFFQEILQISGDQHETMK
jgi:hypothetical protein